MKEDFLPLELGSTDVILGMKCPQTLRDTKVNWGAKVVIKGDAWLSKAMVSLKIIVRSIHKVGNVTWWNYTGWKGSDWRKEKRFLF